ncbi:SpaH/EbpB family LPXTG-anchored major pilin, partial [Corynebacterium nasicanis]
MNSRSIRLGSIMLAGALAASGLGLGAGMADARIVDGRVSQQAVSQIDPTRLISLTIRKAKPNPFDETPGNTLPWAPVEGVTFTIQRVQGVDLTTQEGWDLAHSLTVAQAIARGLEAPISAVTNAQGEAYFTGLPVGLYYVVETPRHLDGYRYHTAAPFLLTLPTGDVDGVTWDYDVVVVAKGSPEPTPTTTPPPPPPGTTP